MTTDAARSLATLPLAAAMIVTVALAMSACGLKGDLYIPAETKDARTGDAASAAESNAPAADVPPQLESAAEPGPQVPADEEASEE